MTPINHDLFDAFRADHAVLGRGLHDIRTRLVAGDTAGARSATADLDSAVGAHIAFEEENFYPALTDFLSDEEVEAMYAEHAEGADILERIAALDPDAAVPAADLEALIAGIERMEHHVSECGQLFGALGGLDEAAMDVLLADLERWRQRAPSWSSYASREHAPSAK
ncbi:hemerythrin domain-containing protein [Parasphingopyxis algicola]|uniref:hemerythrin domain-containing protein n=1 Tax=Parasphingopyxis algicola TaxID=2026624 RepID=UPI0015A160B1|nr:hemerythrin domain-containing protein [Parasphingopyxis algicola]QLC26488.1 hemerythrin domain-containing protein [Parasphingopyxis algicola]